MSLKQILQRLRGSIFGTPGQLQPPSEARGPEVPTPRPSPPTRAAHPPEQNVVTRRSAPPEKQVRHLIVGLDFGTSCTKLVFRDQVDRRSMAVPLWRPPSGGNPYLLPSTISLDSKGVFSLRPRDGIRTVWDPKMLLMDSPGGSFVVDGFGLVPNKTLAAAFLALALRRFRRWFQQQRASLYGGMDLIWELNLGIPARSFDTSETQDAFRQVAAVACLLSPKEAPLTFDGVESVMAEVAGFYRRPDFSRLEARREFGEFMADSIHVRPEIISSVLGYARSPLRREGLYLMVDVGAGTLDVSTFRIHQREGEDDFPIFTSEVQPLGAYRLHRRRVAAVIDQLSEETLRRMDEEVQVGGPLPSLPDYAPNLREQRLKEADSEFKHECEKLVSKVVCTTRRDRDCNASEWSKGLPVFLCGGGSRLAFYRDVLHTVEQLQKGAFNYQPPFRPFIATKLPQPTDLLAPEVAPGDFDRLAVAYGLSFSSLNIGEIQVPSQIDDMPKPQLIRSSLEDRFISKEMV